MFDCLCLVFSVHSITNWVRTNFTFYSLKRLQTFVPVIFFFDLSHLLYRWLGELLSQWYEFFPSTHLICSLAPRVENGSRIAAWTRGIQEESYCHAGVGLLISNKSNTVFVTIYWFLELRIGKRKKLLWMKSRRNRDHLQKHLLPPLKSMLQSMKCLVMSKYYWCLLC